MERLMSVHKSNGPSSLSGLTQGAKILAIDGDGVLVDYRKAFPGVWKKAFGTDLPLLHENAYHATTAYGIHWENASQEAHFYAHFDDEAWETMPAFEGAIEACESLVAAGYRLVCVTSMNPAYVEARRRNFRALSLPLEEVVAVQRKHCLNPKLEVLHRLRPLALVDDLLDNFNGLDAGIHSALIDYKRFDAPGRELGGVTARSVHGSLLEFSRFWLALEHPVPG
jgi:FMN phosphatase YigB (HAD superfamily)